MAKKVIEVLKKATTKKVVKVEKIVCPNCNDSGMTCRECGAGMTA